MRTLLPILVLALFSANAQAEGYVGITQVSEYEPVEIEIPSSNQKPSGYAATKPSSNDAANATKDKAYNGKIEKVDNWTKQAYGLLNDGSQEKYTEGLARVYEEQVRDIRNGGLGQAQEYHKFIEKKMPKIEK